MQPAADTIDKDTVTFHDGMMAGTRPQDSEILAPLLEVVRGETGIDLLHYRRPTLLRRLDGRLKKAGCQDYTQYLERLRSDPSEASHLVEHVTIKVSRFFRNETTFALLGTEVLPKLIDCFSDSPELMIWSAGCGNGEEAYSIAILLREIAARSASALHAIIYATDVDQSALAAAREGCYPEDVLSETPAELSERYFTQGLDRLRRSHRIRPELKEGVQFAQHDLLSGAPVPEGHRFHLVLCRNVLIYFDKVAQLRAVDLLTASLATGGYLCLGEAEQLPASHESFYETIDRRNRLYRKRRCGPRRDP